MSSTGPGPTVPEFVDPPRHWSELSLDGLRAYRRRLSDEEERVSYWRRLVHARIDVLEAEAHHERPLHIDELIRVTQKARNVLLDLEELDDKTLELLRKDYEQLARKAKSKTRTPIRAEEVPERPGRSGARRNKRDDD